MTPDSIRELMALAEAVQQDPKDIGAEASCALYEAYVSSLTPAVVRELCECALALRELVEADRDTREESGLRCIEALREAQRLIGGEG